jgi:hypothetical protein
VKLCGDFRGLASVLLYPIIARTRLGSADCAAVGHARADSSCHKSITERSQREDAVPGMLGTPGQTLSGSRLIKN